MHLRDMHRTPFIRCEFADPDRAAPVGASPMRYKKIPSCTELEQRLHMALSLIEEEGLVKIFRHLDRQRDESGLVAVVNRNSIAGVTCGPSSAKMVRSRPG